MTAHPSGGVHAEPELPTPLAVPVTDDDAPPAPDEAEVRWRRLRGDPDAAGPAPDEPSPTADAPSGWTPTPGSLGALVPVEGAGRWLAGAGAGTMPTDWRALGAAAVRAAAGRDASGDPDPGAGETQVENGTGSRVLLRADRDTDMPDASDASASWAALATGVVLGSYHFSLRRRGRRPVPRVRLPVPPAHRAAVQRAAVLARATALARDLADTPSGVKSPDWFARTADRVLDESGLGVTIRDEHWLAEHGFGGVLAVGGGSARPPRLLELRWTPPEAPRGTCDADHVVLVGKGITFDTGGISIKPTSAMVDMRTDCSGGAAVVAAMRAVAELGAPLRVTGLVPLAENHVSGSAYRPGDVVRHRDGTTSEVTNTDAEGRMVLADALGHAVELLDPDLVVDAATLTGAAKVALGVRTGGVFATSDALAHRVVDAGARVGEAWWPLPLVAAHDEAVTSTIADVRQAPTGPGAIMAALFLRRFTGGLPWVHLDIAGPARCDSPHEEVARGATGFAARTLTELCAPAP